MQIKFVNDMEYTRLDNTVIRHYTGPVIELKDITIIYSNKTISYNKIYLLKITNKEIQFLRQIHPHHVYNSNIRIEYEFCDYPVPGSIHNSIMKKLKGTK